MYLKYLSNFLEYSLKKEKRLKLHNMMTQAIVAAHASGRPVTQRRAGAALCVRSSRALIPHLVSARHDMKSSLSHFSKS